MLCRSLLRRARGGPQRPSWQYSLQHLIDCYQCSQQDDHLSYGELGMPVPPFGCTFPTAPDLQHILAVANEEGFVRLYDTESQTKQIFKEWLAHSNAVFDIAWVPGEHRIVTASGDQTAKVWDVRAGELLGICKGHQCSLKSVAFSKFERAVFCTGGRDGNVMVWDTRVNKKDGYYRQVNQIGGAHNVADKQMPSKPKKKKQNLRGLAPSVDFQQSVTVVLLQDEHTLISAGAVDGIIKVWDLRKNYSIYRQDPVPFKSYCYPGISTRKLGYSSLILDSTGTHLFANCTDDSIYLFNMTSLKTMPAAVFSGHQNSTFYVKSSISPDDQFLVSGSSDQSAYIWKISEPQLPPRMLLGHSQEVTSVAWCPSDFTKIATCSDDNTVRVWRLNRGSEEKNPASDHVNLVGWVCQKKLNEQSATGLPVSRENTPAKFPMTSHKTCSEDCLCLAELNSGLESCSQNPKEPSPPESPLSPAGFQTLPFETSYQKVADMSNKENSSPENKDWLSALGEKLKTNKARSQNSSGSSTPSSRTRRQEAVTAVTPPRPVAADPVPMRKICTYFRRKSQNDSRGTLQQSLTPF
ncbi:denticleless protein-like protein isoform C [Alligator mississippiensis]|uniref:Denticleless protein-like protein isoform C n=1 Tax=Alligator mississippiensis TaxID=8496 RepID=A0A151P3J0_ALLMI|nr:denticleless protein-like protein isoform C [Alligator mississippiensis]